MPKKKTEIPDKMQLLIEWKRRLGLYDWHIVMETGCDPKEMEVEDSEGCSTYFTEYKVALIQIADPEKLKGCLRPFDFEQVLVHELLHLKFCLLERHDDWNKLQMRVLHQIIDDMSKALVEAKRSWGEEQEADLKK